MDVNTAKGSFAGTGRLLTRAFQNSMGIDPLSLPSPINNGGYAGKAMVSSKSGKLAVVERNGAGTTGAGTAGVSDEGESDAGLVIVFDEGSWKFSIGWTGDSVDSARTIDACLRKGHLCPRNGAGCPSVPIQPRRQVGALRDIKK